MKIENKMFIVFLLFLTFGHSVVISPNTKALPKLTGDEPVTEPVIPYFGGSRSPGDSIGMTTYDLQANGAFGQRLLVDDLGQAHIVFTKRTELTGSSTRRCEWQFRYYDGMYYGEVDASPMTSGFVQLEITQDANPDSQRTVIAYHYSSGTYCSWIDVDQGNGWGMFPYNPRPWLMANYLWPYIAITANNNIVMITGDNSVDLLHVGLTTDFGMTWTLVADIDSAMTLSQFVRSSRNSGKVVVAWTQSIAVEYSGYLISQMANDVYYMLSTDNGITWGTPVNVTHYLPPGQMVNGDTTPWAYCDVNAVFDNNDKVHLSWGTNMGWKHNDILYFYDRSKIFHWDEVSHTITTINSPSTYYYEPNGWWIEGSAGQAGAHRMIADNPQLIGGPGNRLYCLWHGNDDTTDVSARGIFNFEFYGSFSTDNGLTWSNYVNLTNTRSPGAPTGYCMDENFMTANPVMVNDSIYLTYVEDKDAGHLEQSLITYNPVRCWVFPKSLIHGVEDNALRSIPGALPFLAVYPNPFSNKTNIRYMIHDAGCTINDHQSSMQNAGYMKRDKRNATLKIFDASGRLVKSFDPGSCVLDRESAVSWSGTDDSDRRVPAGIYFVQLDADNKSKTEKAILLR